MGKKIGEVDINIHFFNFGCALMASYKDRTTGEMISACIIGLMIFFTFVAMFAFWIYSIGSMAVLSILTGIFIIVAIAYHHKNKYTMRMVKYSIFTGMIACIIFFLAFFSVIFAYVENTPTQYIYKISVKGLADYSGSLVTDIIVPLPMENGKQIFTDEELNNKSFGNWTSMLVVSKEGKMIAFQTMDRNLTDIDASFTKRINYSESVKDVKCLYPVSSSSPSNYTLWLDRGSDFQTYTSYVYIDQNIRPIKDAGNITFNVELTIFEGRFRGIFGNNYKASIIESIPEGIKGPIPVRCQLGVYKEGKYLPINA